MAARPQPSGSPQPSPAGATPPQVVGAFTVGSTLRHVLNMTAAGSIGLISVFFVDLLTLLYVSRLGDTALTAAVGYASQMVFLLISVNIGLSIAVGALVSRALGAGDRAQARRLASSGVVLSGLLAGTLSLASMPFTHQIISAFGARGTALEVGAAYLRIILPATLFLGVGMAMSSVLRAVGDAKRAMYVTLGGAIVTACLDPIFIFALKLGVEGAAIVMVISRFSLLMVGLHGTVRVHDLLARPHLASLRRDVGPMAYIAGPAILTNVATPVANIYVLHVFSRFGEAVIAAFAIMDRVTPVAFGVLFALSGSVGPIMGQNFGARAFDRVRGVLTNCYMIAAAYVGAITVVLWLGSPLINSLFDAKGETADLVNVFCRLSGLLWVFLGGVFVANAAFNNLGRPFYSALLNWGRATLGTIPFVTFGAWRFGPVGGYAGIVVGATIFGLVAVALSYRTVTQIAERTAPNVDLDRPGRAP